MPRSKTPKIDKDDAVGWRKEARRQRKALESLSTSVSNFLVLLDRIYRDEPNTPERGRKISKLTNQLEMANDAARYFALDVDYRKDKKKDVVKDVKPL